MAELKPLVCQQCGGAIDRSTMQCPYCGTQYKRERESAVINYVVERPGVHKIRAEVKVPQEIMRNPEAATKFAMGRMRHEIADSLLDYMKISTQADYRSFCQIIRGETGLLTQHSRTTKGGLKIDKLKPCPDCKTPRPWMVRVHPLRWIFTKYYVECSVCHCCGKTKIGKHRAAKAWNRMVEDGN